MEVGPREKERGEYVLVSRVDRNHREMVAVGDVKVKVQAMLDGIHEELFRRWILHCCETSEKTFLYC